jgi:hypothetical protein
MKRNDTEPRRHERHASGRFRFHPTVCLSAQLTENVRNGRKPVNRPKLAISDFFGRAWNG